MNNQEIIDQLDNYIDALIEKKGIKPVGPNSISMIKDDLKEQLFGLINVGIVNSMNEDKLEEFTKLSEEKNQEKLAVFLTENVPNLSDLIQNILVEFSDIYLSN